MRNISAFNFITLNGFYKGTNDDISWHRHGSEESNYSEEMLALDHMLLFGRKTYENMAGFWPSPAAKEMFPEVAKAMNGAEKIVFSNSLQQTDWLNCSILNGDIIDKIKKLKASEGRNMTILGSGSIINQFLEHKLLNELQLMIDPVVIGKGTPLFYGINSKIDFELTNSRTFKSGVILLYYKPIYNQTNE